MNLKNQYISFISCGICESNITIVDRQDKKNKSTRICNKSKEKNTTSN